MEMRVISSAVCWCRKAGSAEGIPYLERAKKVKPDFWAPYFYLGKAKLRLEQPAEAVALLQRAVELNPDEASAYYQLGRALEACGREAEARRALLRVRDLRAAALEAAPNGQRSGRPLSIQPAIHQ